MSFKIRPACLDDMEAILSLIQELADFEKESNAVEITVDELKKDYNNKLFNCFVAVHNNIIVGMALYYNRYSTWKGKTVHLEDLVVTQSYRNKGIGKALLEQVIFKAKQEKVKRLEWCVLDWNEAAITFYKNTGANILRDWYLVQLNKTEIENY